MIPSLAQKQTLVMTPKLQQAIKILQMHRLELAQYVSQQMVENPVLEEAYEEPEETDEDSNTEDDESGNSEDEIVEMDVDLETGLPDTDAAAEDDSPELDITDDDFGDLNWQEYFDDTPVTKNEWEAPPDDDMRDNTTTQAESLAEHLLWQERPFAD